MFEFPKRTTESDLRAFLIKRLLEANGAPRNYMVCVVTNDQGQVFVACSGSGDSALMLTVADQSSWAQQLLAMVPTNAQRNNARSIVKKLGSAKKLKPEDVRRLRDANERVQLSGIEFAKPGTVAGLVARFENPVNASANNAAIADRLVVPQTSGGDGKRQPGGVLLDVASRFGRRDCAEPRAIELAAARGHRLTGMTTIWYGDVATNPMLDDRVLADTRNLQGEVVPFNAATPCEWCQANERRIMMSAAEAIGATVGGRPHLQRRHSISEIRY